MTVPDDVLDGLGPALRDAAGDLLPPLVEGLFSGLEGTSQLLQPTAGGWATVFDLDTTPQPGWLGGATGTKVPTGLTVERQRTYVRDRAAWRRGRLDALGAAVQSVLGGEKCVGFIERHDGNAWRLGIVVYAPDAEDVTEDQIRAAAATQKAVGLVIDSVTVVPAVTYGDLSELYPTYADLADAWPEYPISPERDIPGVRWWHPAGTRLTYARLLTMADTYDDLAGLFDSYNALRDHDPSEES